MKYVYLFLFLSCHAVFLWSCSEPDNAVDPDEEPTKEPEDKDPDKEDEENDEFVDDTDFVPITFGETATTSVSEKQFDAQKFFFAMKSFNAGKKYKQLLSGGKVDSVSRIIITIKDPSKLKNVSEVLYMLSDGKNDNTQRICSYKRKDVFGSTTIKNLNFDEDEGGAPYLSVQNLASNGVFKGFRANFNRKQLKSITFFVTLEGNVPILDRGEFTVAYSSR